MSKMKAVRKQKEMMMVNKVNVFLLISTKGNLCVIFAEKSCFTWGEGRGEFFQCTVNLSLKQMQSLTWSR